MGHCPHVRRTYINYNIYKYVSPESFVVSYFKFNNCIKEEIKQLFFNALIVVKNFCQLSSYANHEQNS